MVKKVILGSLLSVVVLLMVGTAAFAGTPPETPDPLRGNRDGFRASCAAHCATYEPWDGTAFSVSQQAQAGTMGGKGGTAQMNNCGGPFLCCEQVLGQ